MSSRRSRQGRLTAGVGGVLLFIFLFLPWFGEAGVNATGWQGQSSTDIYMLITAAVAVGTLVTAGGVIVRGLTFDGAAALLGGVATILLIWLCFFDFPSGADRKIGVYLSLLSAIVIAFGGYTATLDGERELRAPTPGY
jgi:hypothetical protein